MRLLSLFKRHFIQQTYKSYPPSDLNSQCTDIGRYVKAVSMKFRRSRQRSAPIWPRTPAKRANDRSSFGLILNQLVVSQQYVELLLSHTRVALLQKSNELETLENPQYRLNWRISYPFIRQIWPSRNHVEIGCPRNCHESEARSPHPTPCTHVMSDLYSFHP